MLMFDVDPDAITVIIQALIALLLAIIAYFNKKRTDTSAITANAAVQTSVTNTAMAAAAQPAAPVPIDEKKAGFIYPRDGSKLADGLEGWYARINPSPQAATIPDNQCYQAVSPRGNFHSGDRDTIMYLIGSVEAVGWRARNQ